MAEIQVPVPLRPLQEREQLELQQRFYGRTRVHTGVKQQKCVSCAFFPESMATALAESRTIIKATISLALMKGEVDYRFKSH